MMTERHSASLTEISRLKQELAAASCKVKERDTSASHEQTKFSSLMDSLRGNHERVGVVGGPC